MIINVLDFHIHFERKTRQKKRVLKVRSAPVCCPAIKGFILTSSPRLSNSHLLRDRVRLGHMEGGTEGHSFRVIWKVKKEE